MAFTYNPYEESDEVKAARARKEQYDAEYTPSARVNGLYANWQNVQANKPQAWNGGKYGAMTDAALNDILNRKQFSYDLNGDMLYQQYKDQYINQGRQAMMDTIGQASAMTGGYGNSYAQSVGQQTYNGYLSQLNDKVPELYQLALQKYQMEGDQLNNRYSALQNAYQTEYGEYRNALSDYNTDFDRAWDMYTAERNNEQSNYYTNRDYYNTNYNNAYARDYGQYGDAYERAFAEYQQGVAESQAAQELALKQQSADNERRAIEVDQKGRFYDLYDKAITASTVTRGNRGNTGNGGYDYDGKHYTSYNAAYNAAKNDIADAYNNGYITDAQANKLLDELDRNLKK